jgi:hypothetical protein
MKNLLSQVLSDLVYGRAKDSGKVTFNSNGRSIEKQLFHASAGKNGTEKTCTLFFIREEDTGN